MEVGDEKYTGIFVFFLTMALVNPLFAASNKANPLSQGRGADFDLCDRSDDAACQESPKGAPGQINFYPGQTGMIWPDGMLGSSATYADEAKVSEFKWSLANDNIIITFTKAGSRSGHKNGDVLKGKVISDKVIQIDGAYYFIEHD